MNYFGDKQHIISCCQRGILVSASLGLLNFDSHGQPTELPTGPKNHKEIFFGFERRESEVIAHCDEGIPDMLEAFRLLRKDASIKMVRLYFGNLENLKKGLNTRKTQKS